MTSHRLALVALVTIVGVCAVSATIISVAGSKQSSGKPTNKGRSVGEKLNDFHIVWNVPSQRLGIMK